MKNLLITLGCICFSNLCLAEIFSGVWSGQGSMSVQNSQEPVAVKIDVSINQTPDKLIILDCVSAEKNTRCYNSNYDIFNGDQIFEKERKIGDIFPGRIIIFDGYQQVSEQMLFKMMNTDELHYRYTYMNYDGQMESRFVVLRPK